MKTLSLRSLSLGVPALLGAALSLTLARPAEAAPCSMLPNPVYVTGSGKVVLADLAKALSASGITLIYKLQGSCLAVDAILNGTPLDIATDATASYWDATAELKCDLDTLEPTKNIADIGI